MQKKYIDVEGTKACYIEEGEGFPVIFIHGWLGSSIDFPTLFPFLAKSFRAIALDLPGFGETPTFNKPPTFYNYAKFVQSFVKKLSLGEHYVVGNCYGATISLEYVLQSQDKVKKVVLLTPILFGDILKKKWLPIVKLLQRKSVVKVGSWVIKTDCLMFPILGLLLRNRKKQYILDAKTKKQQADHFNAARAVGELLQVEYRDKLRDIKIPTLVVVFQSDGYLNTNLVIATANLIPDVSFHIVRGKGHLSNPDELLEDYEKISQFLMK